jgi:hypothetical protein
VDARYAFAAEPQRYDLVLTDTPCRASRSRARARHHRIRAGTPVILYTGYGDDIPRAELAAANVQRSRASRSIRRSCSRC